MALKVCLDVRMVNHSGIGRYIRSLLPFLKEAPLDLTLLGNPEQLPGFNVIPFFAPIFSLKEQLAYPKVIPPCDLFWSPHYNVPLRQIEAKRRLVTVHDFFPFSEFSTFSWPERLYALLLMRKAFTEQVITVSNFSKGEILHHRDVSPKNVRVIYNGVDKERFRPTSDPTSDYFLCVGNLKPHKNLQRIIGAFKLYGRDRLIIVGCHRNMRHTQSVQTTEKITYLEDLPDEKLPSLYANAKALLFPSLYEGFGLPCLEAMASGCPVITSNRASLPEVCDDAALYVDPLSVESIREAMEKVGSSDLRERGLKRSAEFCWEASAQKHLEVILERKIVAEIS